MLEVRLNIETIKEALNENNIPFSIAHINGLWKEHCEGYLTYASVMDQACLYAEVSEDTMERMYTAAKECEEEESMIHAVAWELEVRMNPKLEEIPF